MQNNTIKKQVKDLINTLKQQLDTFEADGHLTPKESEQLLATTENLYKNLVIYNHLVKQNDVAADLNVHVKIMEAAEKQQQQVIENKLKEEEKKEIVEETKKIEPVIERKIEPVVETKKEEIKIQEPVVQKVEAPQTPINTKRIELGINDKYRIQNELFAKNEKEFKIAIEQLNSLSSWDLANDYLNGLKSIYNWKENDPLVKSFYALAQKRFS